MGGQGKCVFALILGYISVRRQDRAIVTMVKIIENDTILYSIYDFPLTFNSNYGSISSRF